MRPSSITPRDLEHMLCDETAEPKALPLSLLDEITDGFSDEKEIGRGAFAGVYKGKLENRTVAVKKMTIPYKYEKQFHREVECLMTAKHKNVVRFLGYCADTQGAIARHGGKFIMADKQQRLLCFEYLPKGSIREYITDMSPKSRWRDCYQIITGICQGLHYLHQENIAHLDLKPENILLDDNLVAKIADFGLSRCFIGETESRVISQIGGTPGYWAPEIIGNHTQVKNRDLRRLDIYSLGVVILEILTRNNCYLVIMEIHNGKKDYCHVVDNVVESWSNMVEQSQRDELLEQVQVCAEIGIACINVNPANRPDAQRIINTLDGTETMDEYIKTGLVTSQQAENAPHEQQQGLPNSPGETSSKLVQKDLVFTVKNEQGYELKLLRDQNNLHGSLVINGLNNVTSRQEALEANLAAKVRLTELELNWDATGTRYSPEVEADVLEVLCPPVGLKILKIRAYKGLRFFLDSPLVHKDLVFTVKNEQGYELRQLRDLNNLHGCLKISGLEKLTSMEEALEANQAAKERHTELELIWDPSSTRCSPEVEVEVLEGLCPPMGLKKLNIQCYEGSRYPDLMVGKQNGGPKDVQEFHLHTFVKGPAPKIVEAFPHLRVVRLVGGTSEALPSNMEHLTSLKKLMIGFNKSIRSFLTLPRSLEEFDVPYCLWLNSVGSGSSRPYGTQDLAWHH